MPSLHKLLKKTRLAQAITQSELASKIGVSPQLISAFETGKIQPSRAQLGDLAQTLNVSVALFTGEKVALVVDKISQLEEELKVLKTLVSQIVEDTSHLD